MLQVLIVKHGCGRFCYDQQEYKRADKYCLPVITPVVILSTRWYEYLLPSVISLCADGKCFRR